MGDSVRVAGERSTENESTKRLMSCFGHIVEEVVRMVHGQPPLLVSAPAQSSSLHWEAQEIVTRSSRWIRDDSDAAPSRLSCRGHPALSWGSRVGLSPHLRLAASSALTR